MIATIVLRYIDAFGNARLYYARKSSVHRVRKINLDLSVTSLRKSRAFRSGRGKASLCYRQRAMRRSVAMFESWDTQKRFAEAKRLTARVVDHLQYLLDIHENNAIVLYSETLSAHSDDGDQSFQRMTTTWSNR